MDSKTLVIGGGIGGLATALALLHRGHDVEVYERVPDLQEIGAGLTLSPNGTRLLFSLGLESQIRELGVLSRDRELRLWNTGQAWPLQNQGSTSELRYGAPYLTMHRGDLHTMLLDAVKERKADAVRTGYRCVDVFNSSSGVVAKFENGMTATGQMLVGADGIHSAVREQLHGTPKPQYVGNIFWRGMIPIEKVPERERGVASSWISPQGNVTMYPVHKGELFNFVGTVKKPNWHTNSWTESGSIEECLADFEGWHPNIRSIISHIETPYKWGSYLYETEKSWSKGRITLLGDSCHAMPPSLGQGANMAIEDAVVFARCVEKYAPDWELALGWYESLRQPRTKKVVDQSWAQSKRRHNEALANPNTAVDYISQHWAPSKVGDWYDWIYEYDANAVHV
ncbi:FAD-dependent monooxygenase [Ralstonia soli]|uniref:FAD-dependent monooxygenase n=1 Tax=Ralstonia soli TaxID=2953896 RepID=A0ABT1AMQ7_9RALS|nr:FAD-dependent monooxygenase [Ralstonia soli]MCO5399711.1 FAD-dependent monooxygenase [Ralstonia soli]